MGNEAVKKRCIFVRTKSTYADFKRRFSLVMCMGSATGSLMQQALALEEQTVSIPPHLIFPTTHKH